MIHKKRLIHFPIMKMCTFHISDAWQAGLPQAHVQADRIGYQHTITHLHPAYTYDVRIFAFNAIGISDASRAILFQTEEEGNIRSNSNPKLSHS